MQDGRRGWDMAIQLLSGVLAGLVGLGSVTLYLAAFFFPEVHRRHDFFWSGVGCFYALILWLDASQITSTELVGHLASISLMGWLGWQTLTLRRKRTPVAQQTPYTADSWPTFRREMTALALDILRQTPLRRWLPTPAAATVPMAGIRVSALKAVGYEFVDPVEGPEESSIPRILETSARTIEPSASPRPQIAQANQRSTATTAPSQSASPKTGMTWGERGQGLVTWVQDLVRAKTAPKPTKTVIDIPPRPSSLAKRSASPQPSPPQPSPPQPDSPNQAEDVDTAFAPTTSAKVPPEKPPLDRYPQDTQATQNTQAASNWDDEADEDWI